MILHGDLFAVLPMLEADSVDACVTDPPYGIGFMGREWDTFNPSTLAKRNATRRRKDLTVFDTNPNLKGRTRSPAKSNSQMDYDESAAGHQRFGIWTQRWAEEVMRVLKPGAYIVVCGAPRSYHRMACGLEDAGFELRDCLAWIFGQGFPKSRNLGDGRGTALKPAYEPIVLARKPFKGTVADNVAAYGTGALNIDHCRLSPGAGVDRADEPSAKRRYARNGGTNFAATPGPRGGDAAGRWPANVVIDEIAAAAIDDQSGILASGFMPAGTKREGLGYHGGLGDTVTHDTIGDVGGASRFYYCAKPSRAERDLGCDDLNLRTPGECTDRAEGSAGITPYAGAGRSGGGRNIHPTVKPVALMRWLVRLVTPPDGLVLDPFLGSGTTGMACRYEQRRFIGIEREAEYVEIAKRRIAAVAPLFGEEVSA